MAEEKVICETPTPGKKSTRIDKWKYEAVRRAILKSVPKNKTGIVFKTLPDQVELHLKPEEKAKLGSVGWYTTCVKLDLEVKGKIQRVVGRSPQRLIRT